MLEHLVDESVLEARAHVLELFHGVGIAGLDGILDDLHLLLLDLLVDELVQLRHVLGPHQLHAFLLFSLQNFLAVVEEYHAFFLFVYYFALPPEVVLHHVFDELALFDHVLICI